MYFPMYFPTHFPTYFPHVSSFSHVLWRSLAVSLGIMDPLGHRWCVVPTRSRRPVSVLNWWSAQMARDGGTVGHRGPPVSPESGGKTLETRWKHPCFNHGQEKMMILMIIWYGIFYVRLMGQLQLLYMLSYNFLCVHCFLRLDNPMDEHRQYVLG